MRSIYFWTISVLAGHRSNVAEIITTTTRELLQQTLPFWLLYTGITDILWTLSSPFVWHLNHCTFRSATFMSLFLFGMCVWYGIKCGLLIRALFLIDHMHVLPLYKICGDLVRGCRPRINNLFLFCILIKVVLPVHEINHLVTLLSHFILFVKY